MSALKSANKELKGIMKTVKIQDIDVCTYFLVYIPVHYSCNWKFMLEALFTCRAYEMK